MCGETLDTKVRTFNKTALNGSAMPKKNKKTKKT
jgi:hypothetical protein